MKQAVNPVIQNDIMRYKKNKLAANLALLGLVFGCLYFVVLYAQVKNKNYYYTWAIAVDVIYNLVFLLITFLCSEQVKNYERKLFWLQLVVSVLQIARIFWLPLGGLTNQAISSGVFTAMLVGLVGSGVLIAASAVIGFIRSKSVEEFNKKVLSGEVCVEQTLKELDEAEGDSIKTVENPVIDEALKETETEAEAEEKPVNEQVEDLPVVDNSGEVE